MTAAVDPRLALMSALNAPPYDSAAGMRGTPLGEAARLLDDYRAAVLTEAADRYQGFLDNADTGADPRYWTGIRDMVIGLRHVADEQQKTEG